MPENCAWKHGATYTWINMVVVVVMRDAATEVLYCIPHKAYNAYKHPHLSLFGE